MRTICVALLALASLPFSVAFSQTSNPFLEKNKQIEQTRIQHKVKSIRTYVHAVDAKGRTSKKGELLSEMIYNERGLGVKSTAINNGIVIIVETEYNNQNQAIKMTRAVGGKVIQTKNYEYDTNGKLVTIKNYRPDGTLSSAEDLRGRSEDNETTTYNAKGEVSSKTEARYDSVTRIYTSRILTAEGKLRYENNYKIDEKNQISEFWMTDDTGNKKSLLKYSYDVNGNEVEQQIYTPEGSPKEKYVSIYNDKNLKIEFTHYQPVDTKTDVFRYEYTYYEK